MIRRISTKWVLTVLAAVVLPFVGFVLFVNANNKAIVWEVVRYHLGSIAGELADRVDDEIRERRRDVERWADDPMVHWGLEGPGPLRNSLQRGLDAFMDRDAVWDMIAVLDQDGRVVVDGLRARAPEAFRTEVRRRLAASDLSTEDWFARAVSGEQVAIDHHVSPLIPPKNPGGPKHPENYHVGFAMPVGEPNGNEVVGVVVALMNWSHIQSVLKPNRFSGQTLAEDIYQSSYAWLWKSDADTIIAHRYKDLYGQKVSTDVGLPQLVEAALEPGVSWGNFPEYDFRGKKKNAAFKHTASLANGGFGWVVGVGLDNEQLDATFDDLFVDLAQASMLVLGLVVLGTILIARRTTRPILDLQQQTRRIARGDLETQIEVKSRDELGSLAHSFNRMTRELSQSRAALIKAEKDAAWREMARQVAHEIKNPLTPMSLSVDLLKRARQEESPEFDAILARTIDLIQRQVGSMREIASDFHAFAGAHRPTPERFDVGELVNEVLELDSAWAAELGVRLTRSGSGGEVFVDRGELRRVLINIVSNALEAMPEGGELDVDARLVEDGEDDQNGGGSVRIVVRDTGVGLSPEVLERLFEPYFTTRTHGTGLGLAIARRLLEEMNATITLEPAGDERGGTRATLRIPPAGPAADDGARPA